VDKEKKNAATSGPSGHNDQVDQLLRKLNPEMKRAKPGPEALAAALEAVERLAAEADAADAVDDLEQKLAVEPTSSVCSVCGYRNREQTKFCGMCGVAISVSESPGGERPEFEALMKPPAAFAPEPNPIAPRPSANDTQHFHHHYHHHYFYGSQEGGFPRAGGEFAVPLGHIGNRRVETAVRRLVETLGDVPLVFDVRAFKPIPFGAIRDDVGFRDDVRRGHAERVEDPLAEYIAVEFLRRILNHQTEQDVSRVAVIKTGSWRGRERRGRNQVPEHLVRVLEAVVELCKAIIRHAGGVVQ